MALLQADDISFFRFLTQGVIVSVYASPVAVFFYFALCRPDFQVRFSSIFPKKSLTSFSHPSFLLHHFRYMNKVKNSGKNSEKKWKKAKKVKKYTWILLRFVSLRSEKYSSEAKRKIWSENKRKEAKKEKWNFIVK
jgi:hypothetical protein